VWLPERHWQPVEAKPSPQVGFAAVADNRCSRRVLEVDCRRPVVASRLERRRHDDVHGAVPRETASGQQYRSSALDSDRHHGDTGAGRGDEDTHVEGAKLAILQRQTANHASPGQTAICSPLSWSTVEARPATASSPRARQPTG
jgi:hypothetical protein